MTKYGFARLGKEATARNIEGTEATVDCCFHGLLRREDCLPAVRVLGSYRKSPFYIYC